MSGTIVFEDGETLVVRYDWRALREKKIALRREFNAFIRGE